MKNTIIIIVIMFILSLGASFGISTVVNNINSKNIEIVAEDGYIKWQYSGDDSWTNLVKIEDLMGEQGEQGITGESGINGKQVEIKVIDGYIKWKYEGDTSWTTLVSMTDLKGSNGVSGNDGQNGVDGREIDLKVEDGYIKWRYVGTTTWANLISLDTIKGAPGNDGSNGKDIELKAEGGYIQWRYVGTTAWMNLVSLDTLKGSTGNDGKEVEIKIIDNSIKWHYVGDSTWTELISLDLLKGESGASGSNGKDIEIKVEDNYIKWHYVNDNTWYNLIELDLLKGSEGSQGATGLSAYEIYLQFHPEYNKSEEVWIHELVNGTIADRTMHTVTFMVDDTLYLTDNVKYGTKVTKPENPTKEGYTFVKWIDENGDKWVFNGYTVEKDLVLYAIFDYNYSLVTFNSLGAAIDYTKAKFVYGEEVELPVVSKKGYIFEGWFDGKTQYISGEWPTYDDVNLTAKFTAKKYTITLEANDGSVDGNTIIEVTYGSKFELPTCISNTTTPFGGWYYNNQIITDENGNCCDVWLLDRNVTLDAEYYIPIYDATDLQNMNNNLSAKYKIMNDIDMKDFEWTPVGIYNTPFTGELDGNNHVVNNFYLTKAVSSILTSPSYVYMGIFGHISNAIIQNITLNNVFLTNTGSSSSSSSKGYYAGIIVGRAENSSILNISINDSTINYFSYNIYIGGIVGYASTTTIKDIEIKTYISSTDGKIGGVCGYGINSTEIKNINVYTKISSNGYLGGVVGYSNGVTIDNGFVYADLNDYTYGGGIVGYSNNVTNIKGIDVTGKLFKVNSESGSFVGYIYYSTNIERCSSNMDVYFIGQIRDTTKIIDCFNYSNYGVVYQAFNSVYITNSYWVGKDISKMTTSTYIHNTSSISINGLTDKSILTKEYFTDTLGWNTQIWDFDNVTSEGYVLPMLKGHYNYLDN